MENRNTFSIVEAIKYGFNAFFAHWKTLAQIWAIFMGGFALFAVLLGALGVISFNMMPGMFSSVASGSTSTLLTEGAAGAKIEILKASWHTMSGMEILFSLGFIGLFIVLSMSFGVIIQLINAHVVLKIYDTGSASWRDVFTVKKFFVTGVIAALLAALGSILGLFLLIIPGIYLGIHWMFNMWAVVDGKGSATECLRYSFNIVKGNALRVVGLILVISALSMPLSYLTGMTAGKIPFTIISVILQLILAGISTFAYAYAYRKLSKAYEQKQVLRSAAAQMTGVETAK